VNLLTEKVRSNPALSQFVVEIENVLARGLTSGLPGDLYLSTTSVLMNQIRRAAVVRCPEDQPVRHLPFVDSRTGPVELRQTHWIGGLRVSRGTSKTRSRADESPVGVFSDAFAAVDPE
jgi:hypothetical protein